MKKTLLGLSAAAMLLSFASCKKDYTCTCDYTIGGVRQTPAFPINDAKRGDAHDACDAAEATYRIADPNAECEIGD
jgi:hypothetical protein